MKIVSIEAVPFSIPLRRRTAFAHGSIEAADHVLVRVRTDDGLVGQAEAPARPFTYGESQASIVAAISTWFAPALCGTDPFRREQARDGMSWLVGNHTARGAVDMAIWDVLGQACGRSVHHMLGGYTDTLDVAHILFADTPDGMVQEAQQIIQDHGCRTFKIKTGRDVTGDARAMRLLRDELGEETQLYVDANKGWTVDQVVGLLPLMREVGITALEEPTPAREPLGRRWLAEHCPLPIMADESATTLGEVATQVLDGQAQMISLKTARTGFTESQRIVGLCEGLGVGVVIGSQLDGAIGTLTGLTFGTAFRATSQRPAELSYFTELTDDIVTTTPRIESGRMTVPTGPGLGIEVDADKLAHYRSDR